MSCTINRQPPSAIQFSNFLIVPTSNNTGETTYNPPVSLEKGDTFIVDNFYTQTWCSYEEQQIPAGLLADAKWNSWTSDPVKKIDDLTRISKNAVKVMGSYYIEYAYVNQPQTPLAVAMGEYAVGDATGTPQNIYSVLKDNGGSGRDANSFTVVGSKNGSEVPDEMFYFQLRAYMCRFVFLANTIDPAMAQIKYALCFVPLEGEYFFKSIESTPHSLTASGQDLTSADTFNTQYGSGSLAKNISDVEWGATNPQTSVLLMRVTSSINEWNNTQSAATQIPFEQLTTTLTLDPDSEDKYSLCPIISPQAQLSARLVSADYQNYDVVYRMSVRGWINLVAGETIPALSNIFVYQIEPEASTDGTGSVLFTNACPCNSVKLTPISGTASSTPGTVGIQFQDDSSTFFWLLTKDRSGATIPTDVLNSLPTTLHGYGDFQPSFPFSTAAPRYDLSYVFPTEDKIRNEKIKDLLLLGHMRISYNEGKTWSTWTNISERNAYINPANYLGDPVQPKYPGSSNIMSVVSKESIACDGSSTLDSEKNTYIEVTFSLVA